MAQKWFILLQFQSHKYKTGCEDSTHALWGLLSCFSKYPSWELTWTSVLEDKRHVARSPGPPDGSKLTTAHEVCSCDTGQSQRTTSFLGPDSCCKCETNLDSQNLPNTSGSAKITSLQTEEFKNEKQNRKLYQVSWFRLAWDEPSRTDILAHLH